MWWGSTGSVYVRMNAMASLAQRGRVCSSDGGGVCREGNKVLGANIYPGKRFDTRSTF